MDSGRDAAQPRPYNARMTRPVFLGGSFDPPHLGHLLMAERARETLGVARVDLLVSAQSPHAGGKKASASAAQRVQMARLAVRGNKGLGVDAREVRRAGRSYTIDTVRELLREDASARPVFVIGGDMLADLPSWKEIGELLTLADFAPVFRPGYGPELFRLVARKLGHEVASRLQDSVIEMPLLEISSRAIRSRLKAGLSVRYLLPDVVVKFIHGHGLYSAK